MNGQLKIEKGIPLPTPRARLGDYSDTLRKMKVGQSVVLPTYTNNASSAAAYVFGRGNFCCRKEGPNATRIWRTK